VDRPLYVLLALPLLALVLLGLERWMPLRESRVAFVSRLFVNLLITGLAFTAAALVVRPVATELLDWSRTDVIGLVGLLSLPPVAAGVLTFLLMDVSFYYWHRLNHEVPFLWRFHNVHHVDPDLDVTTAARFHFGEVGLSAAFRAVQITVIGTTPLVYVVYEAVFQACTLFHHSNLRLPLRLERVLNRVIVTPRMHGIHHSQVQDETNSNYSTVFVWWDWLHRSLRLNVPQSRIVVGVPGYSGADDNRIRSLLLMPFRRQRSYWTAPDGRPVRREEDALAGPRRSRLAE
jgi:sterol desaturase/sphingolipid hydroxylase (fatty acid hydroxylase superfamily)